MAADDHDEPEPTSFAARLDYLFKTVHPRGRGEYSYREVAAGVEAADGTSISATYLMYLRKGGRTNPSLQHVEAIARFFGVPATYFVDNEMARRVTQELDLLAGLRDTDARAVALRLADLSPAGIETVARLVEEVRRAEAQASGSAPEDPEQEP